MNSRLRALSAVRRAYLRLEKMACFREMETIYIFKTQHRIVTTLTENILLKIKIIFIEKNGNAIKFIRKHVLTRIRVYENNQI